LAADSSNSSRPALVGRAVVEAVCEETLIAYQVRAQAGQATGFGVLLAGLIDDPDERLEWTAPCFVEALPSTGLPSRRQWRPFSVGLLELQCGNVPAPGVGLTLLYQ
jgi:hypothetical protein